MAELQAFSINNHQVALGGQKLSCPRTPRRNLKSFWTVVYLQFSVFNIFFFFHTIILLQYLISSTPLSKETLKHLQALDSDILIYKKYPIHLLKFCYENISSLLSYVFLFVNYLFFINTYDKILNLNDRHVVGVQKVSWPGKRET